MELEIDNLPRLRNFAGEFLFHCLPGSPSLVADRDQSSGDSSKPAFNEVSSRTIHDHLSLRFCERHQADLPETLCDDRPRTGFLVLAESILRSLQVDILSDRDLCADLVESSRTCLHVTRVRSFKGPVQVLTLRAVHGFLLSRYGERPRKIMLLRRPHQPVGLGQNVGQSIGSVSDLGEDFCVPCPTRLYTIFGQSGHSRNPY